MNSFCCRQFVCLSTTAFLTLGWLIKHRLKQREES
ncbi:unnamed protein product, partial [Rotaria sp. Silwood2]